MKTHLCIAILSIFQGSLAGDGSDSGDYTPVCTKRKRREDGDAFRNLTALLPKTVSTILTVRMNQGEKLLLRHNTEIPPEGKELILPTFCHPDLSV